MNIKNEFWENYKAARLVSKQFRESSTYFQNIYDSFKIGQKISKRKHEFIMLIDHKTPVPRWEYKYWYLEYWKKFHRDCTADQYSSVWDTEERVLMSFKDFVIAAMNDSVSPRNYFSSMTASMFMHSPDGFNVYFS